jgi:uncharacterized protein (TIGR03790 family)
MVPMFRGTSPVTLFIAVLLCLGGLGLGPEQLALVVNKNEPESITLAREYALARHVPDGRIIALDVPDAEEMEFDEYERNVVPPIRDFLRTHALAGQVRCLVTFYGVPFRIRARTDTPEEKKELGDIQDQLAKVIGQVRPVIEQLEKIAVGLDGSYKLPARVKDEAESAYLSRRFTAAYQSASSGMLKLPDLMARHQTWVELKDILTKLGGPANALEQNDPLELASTQPDELRQKLIDLRRKYALEFAQINLLQEKRYDAATRAQVRQMIGESFGPLRLAQSLESQIDYLRTDQTSNSALDNELALLWVNNYPRNGPLFNPMQYQATAFFRVPAMMVSRLDAPTASVVRKMIETSVKVEETGLEGCLALNSYGFPTGHFGIGAGPYKEFDEKIKTLGRMVRANTDTQLFEEYSRTYVKHEVGNVALYCGWYSVRRYIPGMQFSPGAVGYHVASLEMVGLHDPNETGWVHGMLNDGAAATLGAVAEPYLTAFPPPQEFFPLLMTGKLTLAEVYWKTEPMTSWMMCLVGDPLYTPYKVHPAMKVEDLPGDLRRAITGATAPMNSSSRPQ